MKKLILTLLGAMVLSISHAETIPAKPDHYFNDYANIVTTEKAHELNEQLAQFERDTSNQFVVVVYPLMDTDSDPADYCQRVAHSWQVGQADKRNGLVLFVFMKQQNGKGHIRFQTGYGLEGAMPDTQCTSIARQMGSYFKSKNYAVGLSYGINLAIKTINDAKDHAGSGNTKAESKDSNGVGFWVLGGFMLIAAITAIIIGFIVKKENEPDTNSYVYTPLPQRTRSGKVFGRTPRPPKKSSYVPVYIPSSDYSNSSSSSSSSDYSSSSSSDSSFSSGGGDFGGGGGGSDF